MKAKLQNLKKALGRPDIPLTVAAILLMGMHLAALYAVWPR